MPSCKHKATSQFRCAQLSQVIVRDFHERFYSKSEKKAQDAFVLKHTTVRNCKRRVGRGIKGRSRSLEYYVSYEDSQYRVCEKAFRGILHLGNSRINGILAHFHRLGNLRTENRGGDRKQVAYGERREAVCQFISQFRAVQSHYSREKSVRIYLPSDLNISRMCAMYNEAAEPQLRVKLSFFREVFVTRFNIGFGTPRTDVCSFCLAHEEQIKIEDNDDTKQQLQTELRVHKQRAKAFYDLLRERRADLLTLSFDCEKNQVLPRVPDQSAYYSRQLYVYNCTVVELRQEAETPRIYTWNEWELPKGSNEICSCVHNSLCACSYEGIRTVRLCSDGCVGQNKNSTMLYMAAYWLINEAPANVETMELVFPVVGHSFLPADRVFGRIEQRIKRFETLLTPEDYHKIFREQGEVIKLGDDCECCDWKSAAKDVFKPTKDFHFKISEVKRVSLRRNGYAAEFRGEAFYRAELGGYASLSKRGKSLRDQRLVRLNVGCPVAVLKARDVNALLHKHFGQWRERDDLTFYSRVIERTVEAEDPVEKGYGSEDAGIRI
jgi:hypothetical protein